MSPLDYSEDRKKIQMLEKRYPRGSKVTLRDAITTFEEVLETKVTEEFVLQYLKFRGCKVVEHSQLSFDFGLGYSPIPENLNNTNDEVDLNIDAILKLDLEEKHSYSSFRDNSELIRKYQTNADKTIFQTIIVNNIKLVQKVVSKWANYINHSHTFEDLVSEGVLGLIKAIDRFDPSLGYEFSTYATHWIRQAILRAMIDTGTIIRVPVHMAELVKKINREEKICLLADSSIDVDIICQKLGISFEKYKEAKTVEYQFLNLASLNLIVSEENDNTEIGDLISTDRYHVLKSEDEYSDPVLVVEKENLRENLLNLLLTLKERECNVIKLRYGFEDGRERTLEEIARMYGLTRERIRQIEAKALKRIRIKLSRMDFTKV